MVLKTAELNHYGILGMRWGVRRDRYNDTNSKGIRLEKGSSIHRIANVGDEKQGGMKYAAFKKADIEEYEFALGGGENKFNFNYKLKEALISPNEKRQVDAFLETIKDVGISEVSKSLKAKSKLTTLKGIEKELTKATSGNEKSKIKTYDKFMELLYAKELAPVRDAYFNKLHKEGYNMLIDSSDKGVISDAPVIIFNGQKSLAFVSKKKII